jgi:hypothetical protein
MDTSNCSIRETISRLVTFNVSNYVQFFLRYSDDEIEPPSKVHHDNKKHVLSFNVASEIFESLNGHLKVRIDQILNGEEVDMIVYFR